MNEGSIDILYEQGPTLAVCKPSGLLTQSPPGIDSLEFRIKHFLKERDHKPGKVYLGVPHRLDRPASGVLVFGKHVRATRRMAEQFEGRIVKKIYWALVEGDLTPDEGTWRDYLIKVPGEARAEVVTQDHPGAREAVLHYRKLAKHAGGCWLEIELETGRTHQIRIQAGSRGFPILGDEQYGAKLPFGEQFEDWRLRAIGLHARSIALRHPMTQEKIEICAPVPPAWHEQELPSTMLEPI